MGLLSSCLPEYHFTSKSGKKSVPPEERDAEIAVMRLRMQSPRLWSLAYLGKALDACEKTFDIFLGKLVVRQFTGEISLVTLEIHETMT